MALSIAIIEDNIELLEKFTGIVKANPGYSFGGSATNGADALQLIDNAAADVYLVDLGLPDISGIEIIKHATKRHSNCNVIVITVFGDVDHVIASIEAGASGYVLKDGSMLDIADCIDTLSRGGSPISPVIARSILQKMQLNPMAAAPEASASDTPATASGPALTKREAQILRKLSRGMSVREIGELLAISPHTVASHVKKIYNKLAVNSRTQAINEAITSGLLRP